MGFFSFLKAGNTSQPASQTESKKGYSLSEGIKSAVAAIMVATGIKTAAAQWPDTSLASRPIKNEHQMTVVVPEHANTIPVPSKSIRTPSVAERRSGTPNVTRNIDIKKEVRNAPITTGEHLIGKHASVILSSHSSHLNLRNDQGEIIGRLHSGTSLVLSGTRKVTETSGFFVEVMVKIHGEEVLGYVAAKYLKLEGKAVKTPKEVKSETIKKPAAWKTSKKSSTKKLQKAPHKTATPAGKKNRKPAKPHTGEVVNIHEGATPEELNTHNAIATLCQSSAQKFKLFVHEFMEAIGALEGNKYTLGAPESFKHSANPPTGRWQIRKDTGKWVLQSLNLGINGNSQKPIVQNIKMQGLIKLNLDSIENTPFIREAIEQGRISVEFVLASYHHGGPKTALRTIQAYLAGKNKTGIHDSLGTDNLTYAQNAERLYREMLGQKANVTATTTQSVAPNTPESISEKTNTSENAPAVTASAPKADENVVSLNEYKKQRVSKLEVEKNTRKLETVLESNALTETERKILSMKQSVFLTSQTQYYERLKRDFQRKSVVSDSDRISIDQLTRLLQKMSERQYAISQPGVDVIGYYQTLMDNQKLRVETAKKSNDAQVIIIQEDARITEGEFLQAQRVNRDIKSWKIQSNPVLVRNNTVSQLAATMKKAA